ncbi:porin family protein [Pedobacter sp. SYSU D00535]|uniref:porin family protein n=1 Tax=Pedobacter sp. SYSU D00535 TaxID=2810308 RepID=UPI001A97A1D4|nr:porin family protein [Pedobacter sp. SYSU D00535]
MKRILITSLIALAATVVNAQSVTVKAGLNYSNITRTGDDNFKTDFKTGFHAGVGVDIPLVDRLSLAPEIMYSQKGYEVETSGVFGTGERTITYNFVEIPILAKITAAPGFNIHLGPQVSFLTSTTTTFKSGDNQYRENVEEDNDNLRKNLIGGVVGVGFDISPKVNLHGRYALDLKRNDGSGNSTTPEFRNQVFQVGLGFRL